MVFASALAYGAGNIATKLVSDGIDSRSWLLIGTRAVSALVAG